MAWVDRGHFCCGKFLFFKIENHICYIAVYFNMKGQLFELVPWYLEIVRHLQNLNSVVRGEVLTWLGARY